MTAVSMGPGLTGLTRIALRERLAGQTAGRGWPEGSFELTNYPLA